MNQSRYLKRRDRDEARFSRDDEVKEWASIGVSATAAREYARQCDLDELEILSPSIAEMRMATRAMEDISRELSQRVWNDRAKELERRVKKQAVCVKCGHWFDRKTGGVHNGLNYCGYCESICFEPKDTRWPPGKKE